MLDGEALSLEPLADPRLAQVRVLAEVIVEERESEGLVGPTLAQPPLERVRVRVRYRGRGKGTVQG